LGIFFFREYKGRSDGTILMPLFVNNFVIIYFKKIVSAGEYVIPNTWYFASVGTDFVIPFQQHIERSSVCRIVDCCIMFPLIVPQNA
jgi:hypothetical protein